jgi:hypothetical protein
VDRIIRSAEEYLDFFGWPGATTHRSRPGSTRLFHFHPAILRSSEENFYSSDEFSYVVLNEMVVPHSTSDATASSQSAGQYSGLTDSFLRLCDCLKLRWTYLFVILFVFCSSSLLWSV